MKKIILTAILVFGIPLSAGAQVLDQQNNLIFDKSAIKSVIFKAYSSISAFNRNTATVRITVNSIQANGSDANKWLTLLWANRTANIIIGYLPFSFSNNSLYVSTFNLKASLNSSMTTMIFEASFERGSQESINTINMVLENVIDNTFRKYESSNLFVETVSYIR